MNAIEIGFLIYFGIIVVVGILGIVDGFLNMESKD